MSERFNTAALGELRQLLEDAGMRAEVDPSALVPPGVLVSLSGYVVTTLDGRYNPTALVRIVVPDSGWERSGDELAELADQVLNLVEPDGPVTAIGLVLPNDPAPLPALSFPLNL